MIDLASVAWPLGRLGEAMAALARRAALAPGGAETPRTPAVLDGAPGEDLDRWIEAAAAVLGVEAEHVETGYAQADELCARAAPAVVAIAGAERRLFVVVLRSGRRRVRILGPDLVERAVPTRDLHRTVVAHLEQPLVGELDGWLDDIGVPERRRARARAALLRGRLANARVTGVWLLRAAPVASFARAAVLARIPRDVLWLVAAYVGQYVVALAAWWTLARGALGGRLDRGWLLAWALLMATAVPLSLFASWAQGKVAIGFGGLVKQRLLAGVLELDSESIRSEGAGQLFGTTVEAQAVEALALAGGFGSILASVELALAALVMARGAAGWLHVAALVLWVAITVVQAVRVFRLRRRWTDCRVTMTNDLVERMAGHRTRLAQQRREQWHAGEDESIERYVELSRTMDRANVVLGLSPRGWILVGVAALVPPLVLDGAGPTALAIALGGVLLAAQGLAKLASGLSSIAGAVIAWEKVGPIFRAAGAAASPPSPDFVLSPPRLASASGAPPLVDATQLSFRHARRPDPVLRGVSLRIDAGDRVLLEGPSGGGKSTFASLLTGLRTPDAGLLLLGGLDRATLGLSGWRRRIVAVPQFHDNHVLTETLLFNVLMGRRWPPRPEDVEEATAVCEGLGLGDLIARMPAGLLQTVGESGWQLSHGERSRVFVARALLQGADVIVLDESFAALDPETLARCLTFVQERARALVVIAHP